MSRVESELIPHISIGPATFQQIEEFNDHLRQLGMAGIPERGMRLLREWGEGEVLLALRAFDRQTEQTLGIIAGRRITSPEEEAVEVGDTVLQTDPHQSELLLGSRLMNYAKQQCSKIILEARAFDPERPIPPQELVRYYTRLGFRILKVEERGVTMVWEKSKPS